MIPNLPWTQKLTVTGINNKNRHSHKTNLGKALIFIFIVGVQSSQSHVHSVFFTSATSTSFF